MNNNGNGNGNGHKQKITLGMHDEVLLIDMNYMGFNEMYLIVNFIHRTVWKELLSRSIWAMSDWSSRANTLFYENDFSLIGHLVVLSKCEVNNLYGCGYKTKLEIYNTYKLYGLVMPNWAPSYYNERFNYVFKD